MFTIFTRCLVIIIISCSAFMMMSCSATLLSVDAVKSNYVAFLNNRLDVSTDGLEKRSLLFLSPRQRDYLSHKFGTDTFNLTQCPITRDANSLLQFRGECLDFQRSLTPGVEYELIETKRTSNVRCDDMLVEFIYCDLLENKKSTNKHIILFVVETASKDDYRLFGHKYYEDY